MEDKKEKVLPERKKAFTINTNTYECEFPNTGQLIDIEILKSQLSRNSYSAIKETGTMMSDYSRYMVDMIATFSILFPQLKKDLNVKSISELRVIDSKKLLSVYLKEVLPWINEWFAILNSDEEDE